MKIRTIGATEFKTHCLSLFDEVDQDGVTITVTRRGRPVVTVTRAGRSRWKSTKGILAGKVKFGPDIDNFDMADLWNVVREKEGTVEKAAKRAKR